MEEAKKHFQDEISWLKEEQASMLKDHEEVEKTLRAQIGESERIKKKANEDLKTTERRAELAEKKLQCNHACLIILCCRISIRVPKQILPLTE
jgi:hemerythrin